MKNILVITVIVNSILSNGQLLPSYGGERAGQSAFTFLKNDLNVRSAGMAGASVALPGDPYSAAQNPAGLASLNYSSFSMSHLQLGGGIKQLGFFAVIPNEKKVSSWGIVINRIQSPSYSERTEFRPEGTGYKLYSSQTSAGLAYSKQLTEQFQLGVTLKSIGESYTTGSQSGSYSSISAAADVGFLYTTDINNLRFAVLLRNFGTSSSLKGTYQAVSFNRTNIQGLESNTLPTEFSMGLSLIPWERENKSLRISTQLVHPNDNAENYRIGAEFFASKDFAIRMGYRINELGQSWPVGGLGWEIKLGGYAMHFDFAVQRTDRMGWRNTIGLAFIPKRKKS